MLLGSGCLLALVEEGGGKEAAQPMSFVCHHDNDNLVPSKLTDGALKADLKDIPEKMEVSRSIKRTR